MKYDMDGGMLRGECFRVLSVDCLKIYMCVYILEDKIY